ncbi:hypothetical protein K504DRAFT_539027 [Pleomassaria siparia CBS 279.74]|uniref:Uncharacterized protein n=1 Tax=Pleomassaria siparia CBS 279.74 TaxID=1314801 RepID=A0A6G1JSL4_9PLEO|nr:hypothetical protein K504DRAFT_539027 [Pleomassaria siparia CBS 279.74]
MPPPRLFLNPGTNDNEATMPTYTASNASASSAPTSSLSPTPMLTSMPTSMPASTPAYDCGIAPFPKYNPQKLLQDHKQNQVDIRELSQEQRGELRKGVAVTIRCGNRWGFTMPWRLFQAVSQHAAKADTTHAAMIEFHITNQLDYAPFVTLVKWFINALDAKRVPELQRTDVFRDDLSLIRAAKELGMHKYVQHIFNYYWAYLKNQIAPFKEIDIILELALSEEDAFFVCITNRLAHLLLKDELKDTSELYAYLGAHPILGNSVKKTMERYRSRQDRDSKRYEE